MEGLFIIVGEGKTGSSQSSHKHVKYFKKELHILNLELWPFCAGGIDTALFRDCLMYALCQKLYFPSLFHSRRVGCCAMCRAQSH